MYRAEAGPDTVQFPTQQYRRPDQSLQDAELQDRGPSGPPTTVHVTNHGRVSNASARFPEHRDFVEQQPFPFPVHKIIPGRTR